MTTLINKGKKQPKIAGSAPTQEKLSVIYVDIDEITRYENNPRKNTEAAKAVRKSIETFGWRQPIVVDKDYVIIAGDTRYQAALSMGLTEVPIHVAENLTPDQVRAYRLADNKVSEVAEWDDAKLMQELSALLEADFDLSGMGFSTEDIAALGDVKKDVRWLEDYDVLPPPKSKFILISATEDDCAAILSTLGDMGLTSMKYEYSGETPE